MTKFFYAFLICLAFLMSPPSEAKKRRKKIRKWSVSASNGYTFYRRAKTSFSEADSLDVQMNPFFSYIEMARNFGRYETGLRLQFTKAAFVSPFVKLNFIKNRRKNDFVPFVIFGISPAALTGVYIKAGINLFFKRYLSLSPFVGSYVWFRIRATSDYGKYNWYAHGGLSTSFHF